MDIIQIYERFPKEEHCIAHIEKVRWHGEPQCPYCNSKNTNPLPNESRHHCNNCKTSFSATVGTVFHHTHVPLQKWFLAVFLVLNLEKRRSARQLARDLQVNKNTAWRISTKIREAMYFQREFIFGIADMKCALSAASEA